MNYTLLSVLKVDATGRYVKMITLRLTSLIGVCIRSVSARADFRSLSHPGFRFLYHLSVGTGNQVKCGIFLDALALEAAVFIEQFTF